MVALNLDRTPHEIAEQLLAEQAVLQRFDDMVKTLKARIARYEQQFGIPSTEIHQAIEDGRIKETYDVCNWLIDIEVLEQAKTVGQ